MELSANKLVSGIEKHAELIGGAWGALGVWGTGQLFDSLSRIAAGQVHFPSISETAKALVNNDQNRAALVVGVVGYFGGDMVGGSAGSAAKKFGKGVIEGLVAQHILYWSTHSDEGCTQPGFTRSPSNTNSSSGAIGDRGYGGY